MDNGRLENDQQEKSLLAFMRDQANLFRQLGLRIIFESDLAPASLKEFITQLPGDTFGINYDIGNSAALGYNPQEEFATYGNRIVNVHIKDRTLGGTTVPLGTGNANFPNIFNLLSNVGYNGNLILQTARSINNDHAGALRQYIDQVQAWMKVSYFAALITG